MLPHEVAGRDHPGCQRWQFGGRVFEHADYLGHDRCEHERDDADRHDHERHGIDHRVRHALPQFLACLRVVGEALQHDVEVS